MNILIIGGSGNSPSANSVCVKNMAQEFIRRGYKVWNLASGNDCTKTAGEIGGAELWQISESWYSGFAKRAAKDPALLRTLWFKLVSVVRHFFLLFTYPMAEPLRSRKILSKARELVRNHDISLVIAINNGYSNLYAGMKLKQLYGDKIKVVSYHLDLRTANMSPMAVVRSYVFKRALQSMVEESKVVDRILIPYSGEKEAEQVDGIMLEKLRFVGFPVFIEADKAEACDLPFEEEAINVSYIGTLSANNRDPRYILSLLEQVSNQTGQKVVVHFWGNAGEMTEALLASPVAKYYGPVDNRYVRYILDHSDFLLNIGNAIAYNMLPSKVFGLFATGKPIINVITHPKDSTRPYFERYNHCIDIMECNKSVVDIRLLAERMEEMLNKPLREVTGLFDDFNPETICNEILK